MLKVAIDLDGVCYEWERTARYMLREIRGCGGLTEESQYWDWIKERVSKDDWTWLWSEGIRLGLFRFGHCVRGSILGLRQLVSADCSLVVVSHRPASAVPDTLDWLAYTQIPWSGVHIISDGTPKSAIDFDLLVDDKVDNVSEAIYAGRNAVLFDRAWNQNWEMPRVIGWEGVVDYVDALSGLRPDRTRRNPGHVSGYARISDSGRRPEAGGWNQAIVESGP